MTRPELAVRRRSLHRDQLLTYVEPIDQCRNGENVDENYQQEPENLLLAGELPLPLRSFDDVHKSDDQSHQGANHCYEPKDDEKRDTHPESGAVHGSRHAIRLGRRCRHGDGAQESDESNPKGCTPKWTIELHMPFRHMWRIHGPLLGSWHTFLTMAGWARRDGRQGRA